MVLGRFTHTNAFLNAETTSVLLIFIAAISKRKKVVWVRLFSSFYFWILRIKHVKNSSNRFSQLSLNQSWSDEGSKSRKIM